jgi:hypothetical protein
MQKGVSKSPNGSSKVVDFNLGMEQRICEFGFPGSLRDRLVDAVLSGVKTMAIIEMLESEVVALGAVDDRVARAEGETYKTAAGWRSEHERVLAGGGLPRLGGGCTGARRLNCRCHRVVPPPEAALTPPSSRRRTHEVSASPIAKGSSLRGAQASVR